MVYTGGMAMSSDPTEEGHDAVEPPWWKPNRPSRRRTPLTRDQIVDTAVGIVDAEGVDALTVRRLGEALNTGSATVYWYVSGKEELGELVYDRVMAALDLPEPDPARWQEQLKDGARQVYRLLLAHNDLVRLSVGQIPVGPNMLRFMEWWMSLLTSAGLPLRTASYAGDIVGRYVDASVLEITAEGGRPRELVIEHFQSLPADRFPKMAELHRDQSARDADARFEFGLDLLVLGLASLIDG